MLLKGTNYKTIAPASGATIMANGIFMIGAIEAFPFLDIHLGKYLAFLLLIAWIVIYKRLSVQFFHRDFLWPFIKHPVNSFVIGTWIAGVSVLCNVFLKYFPDILMITQFMAILNTFLYFFFLANCLYNFKQLTFEHKDYPVHGVILLSAVGTQSIVVLLNNVFFQLPLVITVVNVLLGFVFYMIGMVLIINRFVIKRNWTLADGWANTNCIIHGALSISGLAIVTTNSFPPLFVTALWVLTFGLLIVIEIIEVARAIKRIRIYGWNDGILNYHVSQWSRNFTFGMFYAFTLVMHNNSFYPNADPLYHLQTTFMTVWAWAVLLALIGEIAVYIKSRLLNNNPV